MSPFYFFFFQLTDLYVSKLVPHHCYLHVLLFVLFYSHAKTNFSSTFTIVKVWIKLNCFGLGAAIDIMYFVCVYVCMLYSLCYFSFNCRFDLWLNVRIFQPLFRNSMVMRRSMPWDLLKIHFTYIHIRTTAFYHSLTHSHTHTRTQWEFNHSQLRLELWLLFGFTNDSIFYSSNEATTMSVNQPVSRTYIHICSVFTLRQSLSHTPTSTNDCEYIFFIDHFLNFIAEHCKVALLSSSIHTHTHFLNLSVCLSACMLVYECTLV